MGIYAHLILTISITMGRPQAPTPELYSIHNATIVRIQEYGAFASLPSCFQGLIHISQLATYKVESVNDAVSENDRVWVKVIEVKPPEEDSRGGTKQKVSFSMRYCDQEDGTDLDNENENLFRDLERRSGGGGGGGPPGGGFDADGKFDRYMNAGASSELGKTMLQNSSIGMDPMLAMRASLGVGRGRPTQMVIGGAQKSSSQGAFGGYELVEEPEEIRSVVAQTTSTPVVQQIKPAVVVMGRGRGRGTNLPAWMTEEKKPEVQQKEKGGKRKRDKKEKKEKKEKKSKHKSHKKSKKKMKKKYSKHEYDSSSDSESSSDEDQFANADEARALIEKLESQKKR